MTHGERTLDARSIVRFCATVLLNPFGSGYSNRDQRVGIIRFETVAAREGREAMPAQLCNPRLKQRHTAVLARDCTSVNHMTRSSKLLVLSTTGLSLILSYKTHF